MKIKFDKEILNDSDKLTLPDSLKTDNVNEYLRKSKMNGSDKSVEEGAIADRYIDIGKKQIKRFHKNVVKGVAIAACLMVCAVAINKNQIQEVDKEVQGERADNYRQIYNKLCEIKNTYKEIVDFAETQAIEEAEYNGDDADKSLSYNGANSSSTNVRTQGVDEGDVVKNDGQYIYVLQKNHSIQSELPVLSYDDVDYVEESDEVVKELEEAGERDHRKIGKDLDIFMSHN